MTFSNDYGNRASKNMKTFTMQRFDCMAESHVDGCCRYNSKTCVVPLNLWLHYSILV